MIKIVGTCHVFNLRERVKSLVHSSHPDVVCVELDKKRLEKLRETTPHSAGLLALMQRLMARRYGAEPGNDMLGAVEGAEEAGIPFLLIDKDIDSLVDKLQDAFLKEFANPFELVRKLLTAMDLPREQGSWPILYSRDAIEFFVQDFAQDPDRYHRQFELLFPFFKRVLLDEREEHMASQIKELAKRYEELFVVVGAGHVHGLERLLADQEVHSLQLLEP